MILEEIAKRCAWVALCLHAAGLGALEAQEPIFKRPTVAFFRQDERLTWNFFHSPSPSAESTFTALAAPDWDSLLVYGNTPRDGRSKPLRETVSRQNPWPPGRVWRQRRYSGSP